MRKTPYLISLAVALVTLALTIVSIALPKWLRVPSPSGSDDLSYIGLYERCELRPISSPRPYPDPSPLPDPTLPPSHPPSSPPEPQSYSDVLAQFYDQIPPPITDPSDPSNPTLPPPTKSPKHHHRKDDDPKYKCRPFPTRSMCDRDGQTFCVVWSTAGYAIQMSVVFAVITLITLGIVSFRFSTRARRRGAWKLVGALTALQVALQIAAMAMIVHLRRTYPTWFSSNTKYGASFILLIISWSISTLLGIGLVGTGFAARAGYRWAAGKRGYYPIPDAH